MNFENQEFSDLDRAENKAMKIINEMETGLINSHHNGHDLGFFGLKIERYSGEDKYKYLITGEKADKEAYFFAEKIIQRLPSRNIIIDEKIKT